MDKLEVWNKVYKDMVRDKKIMGGCIHKGICYFLEGVLETYPDIGTMILDIEEEYMKELWDFIKLQTTIEVGDFDTGYFWWDKRNRHIRMQVVVMYIGWLNSGKM